MSEASHEISRTITVEAPPARVWELIGDFGGIHRWNPSVARPQLVPDRPAEPGTVRIFGSGTSAELKEQLIALDNEHREFSYSMPQPPFPISRHRATMSVRPNGTGSLVTWGASFVSTDEVAQELELVLGDGVFAAGLDSLRRALD
jgi:uncharacterized protein YndB with AHSA1/START domain